MTKSYKPTKLIKQSDNTKTPPIFSNTQGLRTDKGRSDGVHVTTDTNLVWLISLLVEPSHSLQHPFNKKEMHLIICK